MWMNIRQVILTKEINTITFINHITQGANTASAYINLPPNKTHTVQKYIYLLLNYSRSLVLMGYANTVWETNTNDRCSKFGSSSTGCHGSNIKRFIPSQQKRRRQDTYQMSLSIYMEQSRWFPKCTTSRLLATDTLCWRWGVLPITRARGAAPASVSYIIMEW